MLHSVVYNAENWPILLYIMSGLLVSAFKWMWST